MENNKKKKSFEDCISIIDSELKKHCSKWRLKALPSIDYTDISQIIRIHIWKKWDQWDQSRPLEPWLNVIISNQIKNKIRDYYGIFARPCISCAANQGGEMCSIYINQCSECPLYEFWEKNKKHAHDIELPLPLENHAEEVYNIECDKTDLNIKTQLLSNFLAKELSEFEYKVYELTFIKGKKKDEICKELGFTKTKNRALKIIRIAQKNIIQKAKIILNKGLS